MDPPINTSFQTISEGVGKRKETRNVEKDDNSSDSKRKSRSGELVNDEEYLSEGSSPEAV